MTWFLSKNVILMNAKMKIFAISICCLWFTYLFEFLRILKKFDFLKTNFFDFVDFAKTIDFFDLRSQL